MRKILLSALLLVNIGSTIAQNCCVPKGSMKALAMNVDFMAAHESPLPFIYTSDIGHMIQFATESGKKGNAYYIPAHKPTNRVLIVFHEWWGLNDYIKKEAGKIQKSLGDVDVYAIDLYDGNVATDADAAGKLMSKLDNKRGHAIIKGLLKQIGPNKRIATLGWCMGGSWSFTGTMLAGSSAVGCVMYYGFPDEDENHIRALKSDVLYIRGTLDKFISEESVRKFGKRVKATGHQFTLYKYEAEHAFANPSNPKYDAMHADEAYLHSIKFLRGKFGL